MMKLRLLRGFLPRPRPLKIFIRRSMGHSADTSDSSTNQNREAGRNSSKAEHSNPAPIGQFYRFLCRAVKTKLTMFDSTPHERRCCTKFAQTCHFLLSMPVWHQGQTTSSYRP